MTATEEQLASGRAYESEREAEDRELREAIGRAKAEGADALARVVGARLLRIEAQLNACVLWPDDRSHKSDFAACAAVGKLRALRRALRGLGVVEAKCHDEA